MSFLFLNFYGKSGRPNAFAALGQSLNAGCGLCCPRLCGFNSLPFRTFAGQNYWYFFDCANFLPPILPASLNFNLQF